MYQIDRTNLQEEEDMNLALDILDDFFDFYEKNQSKQTLTKTSNGNEICIDVPGIPKEKIKISYDSGKLSVIGDHESPGHGKRSVKKIFSVNDAFFQADKITSRYENGQVFINIPDKVPESTARQIELK